MLTTVALSPYIFAQGLVKSSLPDGSVVVNVNGREVIGRPVTRRPAAGSKLMGATALDRSDR